MEDFALHAEAARRYLSEEITKDRALEMTGLDHDIFLAIVRSVQENEQQKAKDK
jgi:hypothetical protein